MATLVRFRPNILITIIGITLACGCLGVCAEDAIEFNTQFLDVKGGTKYDLSHFSHKGYVLPGKYTLQISINNNTLPDEYEITWYPKDADPTDSFVCLSPEMVTVLGVKEELIKTFNWLRDGECLTPDALDGMSAQADLGHSVLKVIIPQAFLEYTDQNWDPPSRWDEGISGILFDYNINADKEFQSSDNGNEEEMSGNGTVGANLGAWRLRADWQANYLHQDDNTTRSWEWSRYYAFRALPKLGAQLKLGEDYLQSDIFDSFNYLGAGIRTDDQMQPPNLRGYAPDIAGVARTNAKVTITQQGRVLYEKQVPAGPFRIQDLNQSASGELHVRIEEQNGQVKEYDVSTASIPFLTRTGQVQYNAIVGRPQNWEHDLDGSMFALGEASWGIADGWSVYGGGIGEQNYQALALGIGRDLSKFGAVSFDITRSRTNLPEESGYGEGTLQGNSFRVSYAKNFDEMHSRISFAGYRFSEENFMTMNEYLDASEGTHIRSGHDKEMFTVSYNQNFIQSGLSFYLTWTRRTYWDQEEQNTYNAMISKYFDIGDFRNISLSLNAYRNEYDGEKDDGLYLTLSVPWGDGRTVTYNGSFTENDDSHRVGYYQRIDDNNSYQIGVGQSQSGASGDGYIRHSGDIADVDVNASYKEGDYSSVGMTLQGGATLTAHGGALHRSSSPGGSRLMVDASGLADVPVGGYDAPVKTNSFGIAVIPNVNDYNRSQVKIDLDNLPDNAEATHSTTQITLTEGAIGYRVFDVISGEKAMATLRMRNGDFPPFGAEVRNDRKQQVGLVNDDGSVYLAGVNAGEHMVVTWGEGEQCEIELPNPLPHDLFNGLFLPCKSELNPKTNGAPAIMPVIQQQVQHITPSTKPNELSGMPAAVTH